MKADYRKLNDRTQNSSKYHKRDGTNVRAILERESKKTVKQELTPECDSKDKVKEKM
jgi:hypothetical protein